MIDLPTREQVALGMRVRAMRARVAAFDPATATNAEAQQLAYEQSQLEAEVAAIMEVSVEEMMGTTRAASKIGDS